MSDNEIRRETYVRFKVCERESRGSETKYP